VVLERGDCYEIKMPQVDSLVTLQNSLNLRYFSSLIKTQSLFTEKENQFYYYVKGKRYII